MALMFSKQLCWYCTFLLMGQYSKTGSWEPNDSYNKGWVFEGKIIVHSDVENLEKITVNTKVCILNILFTPKRRNGPTNNEARREFLSEDSHNLLYKYERAITDWGITVFLPETVITGRSWKSEYILCVLNIYNTLWLISLWANLLWTNSVTYIHFLITVSLKKLDKIANIWKKDKLNTKTA